jgi:hypothetical protein
VSAGALELLSFVELSDERKIHLAHVESISSATAKFRKVSRVLSERPADHELMIEDAAHTGWN